MRIDDNTFMIPLSGAIPSIPKVAAEDGEDGGAEKPSGFADAIKASWEAGSEASAENRRLTAEMLTGQLEDFPGYMVAGEKSSTLFELNLRVRNKLLDAYSEIMKTPL